MMFRILARDDRAKGEPAQPPFHVHGLDLVQVERTPSRLNPLANIAAIRLDRGEAPKTISGSQFLLFKMFAYLGNSNSASIVVIGICIDLSQEGASGRARGVGVGVLFNRSDHPLPIDTAALPVLFRPAK